MAKNRNPKQALADPTRLSRLDADDRKIIQVIIETPKGNPNKYAFDPKQKVLN